VKKRGLNGEVRRRLRKWRSEYNKNGASAAKVGVCTLGETKYIKFTRKYHLFWLLRENIIIKQALKTKKLTICLLIL